MFSLLQKIGFTQTEKVQAFEPAASFAVKVPNREIEVPAQAPSQEVETKESFSCLNDVFGELMEDEVSYALSKW